MKLISCEIESGIRIGKYWIGVTKGFCGNYMSICIGTTVQYIVDKFGGFENDWDELTAPIEWIYIYKRKNKLCQ